MYARFYCKGILTIYYTVCTHTKSIITRCSHIQNKSSHGVHIQNVFYRSTQCNSPSKSIHYKITAFLHEQSHVVFSSQTLWDIKLKKVNIFIGWNQTRLFIFPYLYGSNVKASVANDCLNSMMIVGNRLLHVSCVKCFVFFAFILI
jgi:hypothetical protein